MERISEVIAQMNNNPKRKRFVRDWKDTIPEGSRWNPGDPGNPTCKECEGTGFLRIGGLPVGHPNFGKLFLCDCVKPSVE
jgi:hypothetical protein